MPTQPATPDQPENLNQTSPAHLGGEQVLLPAHAVANAFRRIADRIDPATGKPFDDDLEAELGDALIAHMAATRAVKCLPLRPIWSNPPPAERSVLARANSTYESLKICLADVFDRTVDQAVQASIDYARKHGASKEA